MTARALMIQGTGSDVGKSVLVAGLCRVARLRGIRVAPFKPQNMSNNAAACADGGEIGRAQAMQAKACGLDPEVDFNPVLLKPQTDRTSQVVVHGRARSTMEAAHYINSRGDLITAVLESFGRLVESYDLVVIEGAGSPSEINLRERDIANMGFARAAGVPVCLVGDIERGGVIASIVGTQTVLDPVDAAMITGFAVNKFRGDPTLFDDGIKAIESRTGWPCYGVVPWLSALSRLPAEDAVSVSYEKPAGKNRILIVAPMVSRIANFDDADPLRLEPGVDFRFIPPGQALPRDADLIVLFGTKATLGDLAFLRDQGWDHDIISHARGGGRVLGICGGYQMLGKRIVDEAGVDERAGQAQGLGLLDIETHMSGAKTVRPVSGTCALNGDQVSGYEIHVGESLGPDRERPMLMIDGRPEGASSENGLIMGCYVHGLLNSDDYRRSFLKRLGARADSALNFSHSVESALDELAAELERALDIDRIFESARTPGWEPNCH
jgi:adenosylcobyric acid synthase